MSQIIEHPLEVILAEIGRASPHPWYYQQFARDYGADPTPVTNLLEMLWLDGLVERADSSSEFGPGVTLTTLGRQVLDDPEALARLRSGEPLTQTQGAIVRSSLRRRFTPTVTRLLLAANFVMFGYSIYLASKISLTTAYLGAMPGQPLPPALFSKVLEPAGGVNAQHLIQGQWWRLLTACFVHLGALHLAMNMYALYAAGQFVEQTWGRWRYALIYAIAGWGGSCLGMAYHPMIQGVLVGASGALCGVLAAEAMWILLNGRHLPREMARRGRSQMLTTGILIVVSSLLPGVSGWGHLGGALAGGAAALLLHYQRFGPRLLRWLLVPMLAVVPWLSYVQLREAQQSNPNWIQLERLRFEEEYGQPTGEHLAQAYWAYRTKVHLLLANFAVARRPPELVAQAIATLTSEIDKLAKLEEKLRKLGVYRDPPLERERTQAIADLEKVRLAFEETRRCLEAGPNWTRDDEKRRKELFRPLAETWEQWDQLLREDR